METKLILNVNKTQNAQLTSLVSGRVGEMTVNKVDVYVVDGAMPYNLTGNDIYFECAKSDDTAIRDKLGIEIIDAGQGHFRYTFPVQTFTSIGHSKQAYFSIESKTSDKTITTQDFKIVSIPDALSNRIPSVAYVSELDQLIKELEQIQLDELNSVAYQEAKDAKTKAEQAKTTSEQANSTSNNVQTQLNQVVINGSIDPETKQARVDQNGVAFPTLKTRIDEYSKSIGVISNLGLLPRDLSKSLSERNLNVKDFGAKGDGVTDDSTSIQNALTLAKTNGSVSLVFPDGVFLIKKRLIIYKNTKITMSPNTILKRGAVISFFANGEPTDNHLLYNGNSNITVTGGVLDGNNSQFALPFAFFSLGHARNIIFRDVTFKNGVESHAFELSALDGVRIENCKFLGCKVVDPSRNYVEAIQIDLNTKNGFPAFGGYDGTPTKNVLIKNCYFGGDENGNDPWMCAIGNHGAVHNIWNENITVEDCVFEGMTYSGFRGYKFKNTKIIRNKFIGCKLPISFEIPVPNTGNTNDIDGVQSGVTQPNYDTVIEGNTILNTVETDAILIKGYNNGTGTIVYSDGIRVANNIIENTNPNSNAISLNNCANAVISGNRVNNSRRLAFVFGSINCIIDNNIDKNTIANGIYVDGSQKINILNNMSYLSGGSGVTVSNTMDFSLINNNVENASQTTDVGANGIHISGTSKDGKIINNTVKSDPLLNAVAYGMRIFNTVTNVQTYNNTLQGKTGEMVNQQTVKGDAILMYSSNNTLFKLEVTDSGNLKQATDTAWTNLTTSFGTVSGRTMRYKRIGGLVTVTGSVSSATSNTTFATLPVGFRPIQDSVFVVQDAVGSKGVELTIKVDGGMILQGLATNATVHMSATFLI